MTRDSRREHGERPSPRMAPPPLAIAAILAGVLVVAPPAPADEGEGVPDGVQMLLPRGGIPAIFAPGFVPAARAGIPDTAWILGVAIGGEARAYDLNLMNGHEVVNDVVGGRPIAAVW